MALAKGVYWVRRIILAFQKENQLNVTNTTVQIQQLWEAMPHDISPETRTSRTFENRCNISKLLR